jgi:hypothetical protein
VRQAPTVQAQHGDRREGGGMSIIHDGIRFNPPLVPYIDADDVERLMRGHEEKYPPLMRVLVDPACPPGRAYLINPDNLRHSVGAIDVEKPVGCPCGRDCCGTPDVRKLEHECRGDDCEDCYGSECRNCGEKCWCDL